MRSENYQTTTAFMMRLICISAAAVVLCGTLVSPKMAGAGTLPVYERVRILTPEYPVQDALLTDQDGQPFRLKSLQGRAALILFGFTHCPDVCPTTIERLRQLEESGRLDPDRVAYVMISVDGERDTPAVMKAYLHGFSPRFIGLTGEPASIKRIAADFSVAFFKGSVLGDEGDYSVSHSPQLFVIDPAGRVRAEFYNASVEAMSGVTLAILNEASIPIGSQETQL